jgi:hypothetical protein
MFSTVTLTFLGVLVLLWLGNILTRHPLRMLGDLIASAVAFAAPFGIGLIIRNAIDVGPAMLPWWEVITGTAALTAALQFGLDQLLERPARNEFTIHATQFPIYIPLGVGIGVNLGIWGVFITGGLATLFVVGVYLFYLFRSKEE